MGSLLDRRIIFCTTWAELSHSMQLSPKSICVHSHYFKDQLFVEVFSMFETFTRMHSACDPTISLGITRTTPYGLIREAQKSKVTGIIPASDDFNLDETMKAVNAQWAGIPYWPKHILEQLPGANKMLPANQTAA